MSQEKIDEQPQMGFLSRLINVFVAPSSTFTAVKSQPKWVLPALLFVLLTLVYIFIAKPVIMQEQVTQMQTRLEERGLSQQQIDQAIQNAQKITKYSMYPSAVVVPFIMFFISAGIYLFVVNTILGGQAKYTQILSTHIYRSFIPLLGSFIKLPIVLSRQTINVHFSIATFMSDSAKDTFLYKFLSQIEVFNIWSIAVLCIGLAVVANLNVKKVWPWIVAFSLIWYVLQAVLQTAF